MPPHCDTLDGPVVKAIKLALETANVNLILPWVPEKAEPEVRQAFEKNIHARKCGKKAMAVADYWLYETVVRLHREGEGASYTGLKPAGLDWGPVVPRAEKAIEQGEPKEVIEFLSHTIHKELEHRFSKVMAKKNYDANDVSSAREYVQANLGFVLFSPEVYAAITGNAEHGEEVKKKHVH